MTVSCEIIKDLLPLYHDDVCSRDSKAMVEAHLANCESCKAELQAMDEVLLINNTEQNLKEADAVKNLSKKWKRGMLRSLLKGALFAFLTAVIIAVLLYMFIGIKIVR